MSRTQDTQDVQGKVVAITGGSSGIGRAAAERFVSAGARVALLARGRERLDEAAHELGSSATPIVTDITDPRSVQRAFEVVEDELGGVDILLNVAGAARARLLEEATDDDVATVIGVNLLGPIYTTRAVTPLMRARGGGDIVNVSSEVTLDAMPLMTLYGTSKVALEALSRLMNRELKSASIRVSALVVGRTSTGFISNFTEDDLARALPVWEAHGYERRIAGAEAMPPEWVADALFFQVTRPPKQMIDVMHVRSFT